MPETTAAERFEAIFDEYGAGLYQLCYRLCGNPADAEDLTQETLLLAYQNLASYAGRSSLRTWLFSIAIHRWQRLVQARKVELVGIWEAEEICSDLIARRTEDLAIDAVVAGLPDSLRECFILVKSEGLKYREAAEVLDLPIGTVMTRVRDAAERIRAELLAEPCGKVGGRPTVSAMMGVSL